MLKFSILVLACLYSQASGLYFGRYDVIVRSVDDIGGGEATRRDASNLTRVIPTGLTGNENLIPNLTELTANNTRGSVVNESLSHASEVVKNAIDRLEDDTEKAEQAIAAAVATAAAVKAAADAAAPTVKDATEDVAAADDSTARPGTDNAEVAPVPPKSRRDSKRMRRRSRVSRKTGGIDYDYDFYPPPSTKRPYTGIVGVPEDYPAPRHSSRPRPPYNLRQTERPPPFDFPDKM